MAKKITIGDIVKSKNGTGKYIKVFADSVVLTKGQYINVESKAEQLASLESAREAGKISEETYENALARLEKIPDYVIAQLSVMVDV